MTDYGRDTIDLSLYTRVSNALRVMSADMVQRAGSGHPGMPMGMADVMTVLFSRYMKFCPSDPLWHDRDRFVLSAGHGSALLYALLHLAGYEAFTIDQLKKFRQLGSLTAGHPEYHPSCGIEVTTGPLGQGIAMAVGMALAKQIMSNEFGRDTVDHHVCAVVGDGCLMEGISQEAITFAGHMKLSKLLVLWDDNGITIDGGVDICDTTDQVMRFQSAGWRVIETDGHNYEEIDKALGAAWSESNSPVMVRCRTVIGYGAPNIQGSASCHGAPLGNDEIQEMRHNLGWECAPFTVPEDVEAFWQSVRMQGKRQYNIWKERFATLSKDVQDDFLSRKTYDIHKCTDEALTEIKTHFLNNATCIATRKASQKVLDKISLVTPCLIGGSADLTASNLTRAADMEIINHPDYKGRYVNYGIREHFMGAAMNGIMAYGCGRAYGGTFLVFSDYMRPAMRLSSLMKLPVIYVMTHDSIALGEDGPTHQPIEHLSALRASPDLYVFRPSGAVETVECWQAALHITDAPSVLVLSRQNIKESRIGFSHDNLSRLGGYILCQGERAVDATIISSGAEVVTAMEARNRLESMGISTQVVSMPCHELFMQQDKEYRSKVLPSKGVRVAVEASLINGWERWLYSEGGCSERAAFVGMDSYGASAPAGDLFEYFNITVDAVVRAVLDLCSS